MDNRDTAEECSLIAAPNGVDPSGPLRVDHLTALRATAGLTQTEVAKRMKTSQGAVAKLEADRHDPRLSTLVRYATAFDVPNSVTFSVEGAVPGTLIRVSDLSVPSAVELKDEPNTVVASVVKTAD